ncbi:MAG: phosphate propanoyltransferase [Candidatus Staskawiczbacteria bacterium]|nr:phosphate propanoyltransferase [Candidatus Staskawiczbacteria bacterium]
MWKKQKIVIPIEISARHCHLSKTDLEKLFGESYELKKIKQLSASADFACEEKIILQVGSKKFENVRVVGPLRSQTQVEISLTDAIGSGVVPPIRLSGNLEGSSEIKITGPNGEVELQEGLIIAKRHIHCATYEAKKYKLKHGDVVSVRVGGERPVVFEDVAVRVKDDYRLCLHLDTDEGNAAGINKKGEGEIV